MLASVNAERAKGADCRTRGVYPAAQALTWSEKLETASLAHSQDMAQNNIFSHTSADGRTLADRVNATGYEWSRLGENIAAGYPEIALAVAGWMASDGHCANLMEGRYREIGMACVVGTSSSRYSNYWTQDFGSPP